MQTMSLQNIRGSVFVRGDAHLQKSQIHPAHHGQEPMSSRTLQRLMVIKIIPKLLGFLVVFFASGIFTRQLRILLKKLPQLTPQGHVFIDPLGDDVPGTLQSLFFRRHRITHKITHFLHRPGIALIVQQLRQRL